MQVETSYINMHMWTILYTQCIKFISAYGTIHIKENSRVTNFIIVTENWCADRCATDGLVDAHEQEHPNGYQSRQSC